MPTHLHHTVPAAIHQAGTAGRPDHRLARVAMAIGLALASLGASLPAHAATVNGCVDGNICMYMDEAGFKAGKVLSSVVYNDSRFPTAELYRAGRHDKSRVDTVRVVSLAKMIGNLPSPYIYNNSDRLISYITYVEPSPIGTKYKTIYFFIAGNAQAEVIGIPTELLGACRVNKNDGQFVDTRSGKSLPLGNKDGEFIKDSLLQELADNAYDNDKKSVDFVQLAKYINDAIDLIPDTNKITADDLKNNLNPNYAETNSSRSTDKEAKVFQAGDAAITAILAKNKSKNARHDPPHFAYTNNQLELQIQNSILIEYTRSQQKEAIDSLIIRKEPPPPRTIFQVPAAGPSYAGILVAASSKEIDGDGIYADVPVTKTEVNGADVDGPNEKLCNTLRDNKAGKN